MVDVGREDINGPDIPRKGQFWFLWCFEHGTFWHESRHGKCPTCGYQTYPMNEAEKALNRILVPVRPMHEKTCTCANCTEQFGKRHPLSVRFHELLKEMGKTHDRKAADYGRDEDPLANVRASTDFGVPAWVGAMVRANDKIKRMQSFALKGELKNEPLVDAFMDLAVYALIARILYEEESSDGKG